MSDAQLAHVGGLLKAALNAEAAGTVDMVYAYRLPQGSPLTRHPCLELYRTGESFVRRGNASQRLREVSVVCTYYVGPVAQDKLDTWAGDLVALLQSMDDVIETGSHSSYQSGASLYTLAAIEKLEIESAKYDPYETGGAIEGAYPALQLELRMVHRYTRYTDNREELATIEGFTRMGDTPTMFKTEAVKSITAEQCGTDGQITASTKKFYAASALFLSSHVGWYISVADATNAANNGYHEITGWESGIPVPGLPVVTIGNSTGLVNESSLHWVLVETP